MFSDIKDDREGLFEPEFIWITLMVCMDAPGSSKPFLLEDEMREEVISCDECTKIFNDKDEWYSLEGTFTIHRSGGGVTKKDMAENDVDFCSLECLTVFLAKADNPDT